MKTEYKTNQNALDCWNRLHTNIALDLKAMGKRWFVVTASNTTLQDFQCGSEATRLIGAHL
jgi:hypothetical protein